MPQAQKTRRRRGSLSQDEILRAALSILDAEDDSSLTFNRLGEELGASPTAVYRHFASRSDLVRSISEHLDGLSLDGYEPTDDWRVDLWDLALRAWRTAQQHPAAAAISMYMNTGGMNELRAVDVILRALHMAGLSGMEAVAQYQVYANLVLGSSASEAARLNSPGASQQGWVQNYEPADPANYPYADALRSELRLVDSNQVFRLQVEMFLRSLEILSQQSLR